MSTIRFSRESLTDALWAEALPLLAEHWKEVTHFLDIPLNPDRAAYASADASGMVRCFTARSPMVGTDSADELVGYALFFVRHNPHYAQSLQAAQDVIYVAPWARGRTGYQFIKFCDEQLAAEGVQVVRHHLKDAHNFGRMLERQGYEVEDIIYTKRLDKPTVTAPAVAFTSSVRTPIRDTLRRVSEPVSALALETMELLEQRARQAEESVIVFGGED